MENAIGSLKYELKISSGLKFWAIFDIDNCMASATVKGESGDEDVSEPLDGAYTIRKFLRKNWCTELSFFGWSEVQTFKIREVAAKASLFLLVYLVIEQIT